MCVYSRKRKVRVTIVADLGARRGEAASRSGGGSKHRRHRLWIGPSGRHASGDGLQGVTTTNVKGDVPKVECDCVVQWRVPTDLILVDGSDGQDNRVGRCNHDPDRWNKRRRHDGSPGVRGVSCDALLDSLGDVC